MPVGVVGFVEIVSVEPLPAATGLGLNVALVFPGSPEVTPNVTELPPPIAVVFTVSEPLDLRLTVSVPVLVEIEKSAAGLTVRETVVAWVPLLPVPLMVSVTVPVGVLAVVAMFRVALTVLFAGGVTEAGLMAQVVLAGHPDTESPTAALKPFSECTVIVELPGFPGITVIEVGFAESEKSEGGGGGLTVNETVVV